MELYVSIFFARRAIYLYYICFKEILGVDRKKKENGLLWWTKKKNTIPVR